MKIKVINNNIIDMNNINVLINDRFEYDELQPNNGPIQPWVFKTIGNNICSCILTREIII
jgi:hypothetical protein